MAFARCRESQAPFCDRRLDRVTRGAVRCSDHVWWRNELRGREHPSRRVRGPCSAGSEQFRAASAGGAARCVRQRRLRGFGREGREVLRHAPVHRRPNHRRPRLGCGQFHSATPRIRMGCLPVHCLEPSVLSSGCICSASDLARADAKRTATRSTPIESTRAIAGSNAPRSWRRTRSTTCSRRTPTSPSKTRS